ncbi:MAG: sialate O-acetylesterase, partial [Pirellulaceae bacterium]
MTKNVRIGRLAGIVTLATMMVVTSAYADVRVPSIFGGNMVLQRDQENPIWGWAEPGEKVIVKVGDQQHETTAGDDGAWRVTLQPMSVGEPRSIVIEGKNRLEFNDVLVGEVWLCSGQSNMQWSVSQSNNADLETLTANFPNIRLISVPRVGTQEEQDDFQGEWRQCSTETVGDFSAVGYFFGRQLHQSLGVPIGLIDNSWGGSACEAWVRRDLLQADEAYGPLLERWAAEEAKYEELSAAEPENDQQKKALQNLKQRMTGQHRPGNLYCGVLNPIIGYGIRGAIWYQGESNASRAYQYRDLFPLMIKSWREEWKQGDFPFYWVQLADFKNEVQQPGDSDWAELREAQTMTMDRLPNTGEAVIIDIGEGRDIHPRNKQDVALRLARWALANEY